MISSMTGYGKGIAERDGYKVTVELKSVNHRFLDLSLKTPRGFGFAEETLRRRLRDGLKRGHVDVFVNFENTRSDSASVIFNESLAKSCADAASRIYEFFSLDGMGALTGAAGDILRFPDVLTFTESALDENAILALLDEACGAALEAMTNMRRAEGARLEADLESKLAEIEKLIAQLDVRRPFVTETYREKLEKRVREALNETELDEARLLNEVTFFVDKSNVDEEITRLKAHLAHYREILEKGGAVGKPLDFLTQEMNREINTIGSKSNDLKLTEGVLALKNVVEMVREQIQNLE